MNEIIKKYGDIGILNDLIKELVDSGYIKIITRSNPKDINDLIDYYNNLKGAKTKGDITLKRSIDLCLKEFGIDNCYYLINCICKDSWWIENNVDRLHIIFQHTKFGTRLEKFKSLESKDESINNRYIDDLLRC